MFLFLRYLSRSSIRGETLHHHQFKQEHDNKNIHLRSSSTETAQSLQDRRDEYQTTEGQSNPMAGDRQSCCISFTVWRKSLLINSSGFTVIDSDGHIAYRVDNYSVRRPREVVLMDGTGKSLLTLRRLKKLGPVANWLVYEGEGVGSGDPSFCKPAGQSRKKLPICSVRKRTSVLRANSNDVLAYVCSGASGKIREYAIEGSYANRSCKVLDWSRRHVVAEIKRKETSLGGASVSFGLEVFELVVQSGFDSGFAVALVLLLDQMFA